METQNKYTGRVKWFNTKAGYGFITTSEQSDVFVHHSSLSINREQYRYLVQGEYVEFTLSTMENSNHKYQATNVTGLNNGKLMCETRYDSQILRNCDNNSQERVRDNRDNFQKRVRVRDNRHRVHPRVSNNSENKEGWKQVSRD